MRKFVVGAAAAAMVAGSSIAQAAPAPMATGDARMASSVGEAEALRGDGGIHLILGLLAAALLVFVLFQINDQDEKNLPTSP